MAENNQVLINLLFSACAGFFGIILTIIGYNFKQAKMEIDNIKRDLAQTNLKMAESYVSRTELEKTFSRLFDTMDDIKKELAHISRNQAFVQSLRKTNDDLK